MKPKLTAKWYDNYGEVCIAGTPKLAISNADERLLSYHLYQLRNPKTGLNLIAELQAMGYDLKTFKFSIEKVKELPENFKELL